MTPSFSSASCCFDCGWRITESCKNYRLLCTDLVDDVFDFIVNCNDDTLCMLVMMLREREREERIRPLTDILRSVDGSEDPELLEPSLQSRPASLETQQPVSHRKISNHSTLTTVQTWVTYLCWI